MKDIHEVLRRKQAKYAQLAKQIEALQQAAESFGKWLRCWRKTKKTTT